MADYNNQYLTLIAKGSGNFQFETSNNQTYSYSTDEGSTWVSGNSATTIAVNNGERVMFKGTLTPDTSSSADPYGIGGFLLSTLDFEAEGNPMSLLYGDNFIWQTSLSGKDGAFTHLFERCWGLTSIENLKLPATTLSYGCYSGMFYGCSSLTSIPSGLLPATTLAEGCYSGMFNTCSSLTSVPSDLLPATTLASDCYRGMFSDCTSLTSIPSDLLNATTLAEKCYNHMFAGCTSLTTIPPLKATTLASGCYEAMFYGCSSLTTVTMIPRSSERVPNFSFQRMFHACTSLNSITCLEKPYFLSFDSWVEGVSPSGTFYKYPTDNWDRGDDGIPVNWNVVDYYEPIYKWERITPVQGDPSTFICDECPAPPTSTDYITLVAKGDGNFQFKTSNNQTYYYSTDEGQTWNTANSGTTITVNNNDKVMFKGTLTPISDYGVGNFETTTNFEVEGNVMSLLFDNNFIGKTSLVGYDYAFKDLFRGCTTLTNIENLKLLATTLSRECYRRMFNYCSGLTSIPSGLLPAMTLADSCYEGMFADCTSLASVPSDLLQATTLENYCYADMFAYCSSLTKAPTLLAPTLVEGCYSHMFSNCASLNEITCYATSNISAIYCTTNWVYKVRYSGIFNTPSSTSWESGSDGIPKYWTRVDI